MFWPDRTPLSKDPTDIVYPVHTWDNSYTNRRVGITLGLRFEAVLDPAKLQSSLTTLLSSSHEWRKLSGRLRAKEVGAKELELHAPATFTPQRPAFRFSVEDYESPLSRHPLAAKLPKPARKVTLTEDIVACESLFQSPDRPTKLEQYLITDEPILAIHVSKFVDATLIGICFPHILADAGGLAFFLRAWIAVLDDKPPLSPIVAEDRPAQLSATTSGQDSKTSKHLISGWALIVFVFWMLFDIVTGGTAQTHSIYVPASKITKLREEALQELPKGTWISDGDILLSWWIQLRYPKLTTGICVFLVIDARGRHDLIPENYVGNAMVTAMIPLLKRDTLTLGQSALTFRKAILEETKSEEVARCAAFISRYRNETGREPVCVLPGTQLSFSTSWTRMKIFDLDFRGALASEDKAVSSPGPVLPHSGVTLGWANGFSTRHVLYFMGKDKFGGYWLQGRIPAKDLERFKAALYLGAVE